VNDLFHLLDHDLALGFERLRSAPFERCRDPPVEGFAGVCSLTSSASLFSSSGVATIVVSLTMKRGAYAKWTANLGFATAALDIIGSYP
jgi:hypothetical protein